jgi:hypothetical protein
VKTKRCKQCKKKHNENDGKFDMYSPPSSLGFFCNHDCAVDFLIANPKKRKQEYDKQIRKNNIADKKSLLSKMDWVKKVQIQFNKFIRLRDKDDPCISCGIMDWEIKQMDFGKWDCGHFRSRGAAKQLRFDETNAHKQCKSCNGGSAHFAYKLETVTKVYERNLILKIGKERVEYLKNNNDLESDTIESLIKLEKHYKLKVKSLQLIA